MAAEKTALPPGDRLDIVDMHTAGEPVRIYDATGLDLGDGSILDKRRRMRAEHDRIRRCLMLEPRGHADMYGAILVRPHLDNAEAAVLFMHNSGYSTMCGHATIALGRFLNDQRAARGEPRLESFVLECPCGPVTLHCRDDRIGFDSVICFASGLDEQTEVPGFGSVDYDLGYGGAYYAILPASRMGLDLDRNSTREIADAAGALVTRLRQARPIDHAGAADLGFLYGAILTDEQDGRKEASRHVCWFGDGQIDRSPTGSGVSARLAVDAARGSAAPGETHRYAGISGDTFEAEISRRSDAGVVVRVCGRAFYSGTASFIVEAGDPFADGLTL